MTPDQLTAYLFLVALHHAAGWPIGTMIEVLGSLPPAREDFA